MGRTFFNISIEAVLAQVKDVRKQGYAFSRGAVNPGGGMIAMPLPVESGEFSLAVGVAGPLDRLMANEASIAGALKSEIAKYRRRVAA
jgi:DNA-binding IclR family transcriptional regulator